MVSDERAIWLGRHVLPHEPALRSWLKSRRLGGLDADDIIQETYTRLIGADSVSHICNVRNYLFQTAGSVVVDHLRRMKIVSFASMADFELAELADDAPSPEHEVIDRDELQRLSVAIAALPEKVREVFVLRRVHGLSQRQTAARLGLAESTVEKHMAKGFLLLPDLLAHGGNPPVQASMSGQRKTKGSRPHDKEERKGR